VKQLIVVAVLGLFALPAFADPVLIENFDNVATLGAAGWALINNSSPIGTVHPSSRGGDYWSFR
jgi:hypothetical protein